MKLALTTLLLLLTFATNVFGKKPQLDSLFGALEDAIQNRKTFEDAKKNDITSFKKLLQKELSLESRYEIQNKIISEYLDYNFDSIQKYLSANLKIALEIGNPIYIKEIELKTAKIFTFSGREADAFQKIKEIEKQRDSTPKELLYKYYRLHYDFLTYMTFQSYSSKNRNYYYSLSKHYHDSITNILPKNSGIYLELLELGHFYDEDYRQSIEINKLRLNDLDPKSQHFPVISFYRAFAHLKLNEIDKAKKFFILSAIRDIELSRKNNPYLVELAALLYKENKIELANKYINIAMEDARSYNSNFRFLHLSSALPIINKSFLQNITKQKAKLHKRNILLMSFAILLFFITIICFTLIRKISFARNELKKLNADLHNLNNELKISVFSYKESNRTKELHLGHFLEICSQYIDKLDNYRKMVNKEVSNRNYSELFQTSKSKKLIELEQNEFHKNFDKMFLSIYPNFVDQVNGLLRLEERIILDKGEFLNTELRILALIKLGIKDSRKIAKLLRYSVSTIYNYRTQMKNKTKGNRESLDDDILNLTF